VADVIIIGGGIAGLCSGMLLARDGHRVRILDRDPAPPPAGPDDRWAAWERRGVTQFRQLHGFLPRFRQLLDAELPDVVPALIADGALHANRVASLPEAMTGGLRPGDERFAHVTGRRPVVEGTIARLASQEPGLEIRRGVAVRGLLTGTPTLAGVPHVIGVVTAGGDEMYADLVVDAGGRRSPIPSWLAELGERGPVEHADDDGFVYYARHFRSPDGTVPAAKAPPQQPYDSVTLVTLPADNGTWGVAIVASAADKALRALRRVDVFDRIVRSYPLAAHWVDGEPLTDVDVFARIEDRHRQYWVDDQPVVTGLVAVGDAWACTNPSLGRGATIGLRHVVALRDVLAEATPRSPVELVERFAVETAATVEPLYHDAVDFSRHRLAEIDAQIAGRPYETDDLAWRLGQALRHASTRDPDLLRAFISVATLLERGVDVFRQPGVAEKALALGTPSAPPGPGREDLLELLAA
jgi:2-polyprenyl-6-methoxyphenol hydroxylase-like FAD-dependent oxidoreductase